MAKADIRARRSATPEGGLWDSPRALNLIADLLLLAASVGLGYAAVVFGSHLPLLPLREVVIAGAPQHLSTAQLEEAARRSVSGNFLTVDLEATRQAFTQLPWVREARIRRVWPAGLEIGLQEHSAVARWGAPAGSGKLVNPNGEIFVGDSTDALPTLIGPAGSATKLLDRYREVSLVLAPLQRRVQQLVLSPREAWQITLDNQLTLQLGRDAPGQPWPERLRRFVDTQTAVGAQTGTALLAVDLRYPNGYAIRIAQPARH